MRQNGWTTHATRRLLAWAVLLAGCVPFTEAAVATDDALRPSDIAQIITPADPAGFRMNVGVRTLSSGPTLSVQLYTTSGALLSTITKGYSADFFQQVDLASFLNGAAPGPNQVVSITVTSGSAIVYANGRQPHQRFQHPARQPQRGVRTTGSEEIADKQLPASARRA
jgi:hypothetical protein